VEKTTTTAIVPRKKHDHLKGRYSMIDRYGLGADLVREILQGGGSQRWEDVKKKLEDKVLSQSGVVINIPVSAMVNYYQKIRREGFDSMTLASYRRELADNWVRNLNSIQDQFADLKVLMEKSFQESNVSDYTAVARMLNEVTRLMAEIHANLNVNNIVRDKIVGQINQILEVVKVYPFPELTEDFHGHSIVPRDDIPSRSRISERKLDEIRLNLVQYIVSKMPEISEMFKRQQYDQEDERRDGFVAATTVEEEEDDDGATFSTVGEENGKAGK